MGLVLPIGHNVKFQSFFLNFKMPVSNYCEDCHWEHLEKVWLRMLNCRRSSVLKFSPRQGPMLIFCVFFFLQSLNLKFQNVNELL